MLQSLMITSQKMKRLLFCKRFSVEGLFFAGNIKAKKIPAGCKLCINLFFSQLDKRQENFSFTLQHANTKKCTHTTQTSTPTHIHTHKYAHSTQPKQAHPHTTNPTLPHKSHQSYHSSRHTNQSHTHTQKPTHILHTFFFI